MENMRNYTICSLDRENSFKYLTEYDLKDKIGLCVAVGDKYGPIEKMTNIYQAKTFLLHPKELEKMNQAVS